MSEVSDEHDITREYQGTRLRESYKRQLQDLQVFGYAWFGTYLRYRAQHGL